MRMLPLVLLVFGCTASPRASEAERARVRRHLEGAYEQLVSTHPALPAQRLEARRRQLAALRRYIDDGRFPVNDVSPTRTPIFVDRFGNRCAMAALIEASGHHALVRRVSSEHNLARIAQLASDPELVAWLELHGLTADEAARVQPSYDNETATTFGPTAAVMATGSVGGSLGAGFELAGGPALRVGVRRLEASSGACDHCVHRSQALVLEYARLFQLGRASTNQLAVTALWDLIEYARDHTLYGLAGVVGTIDESSPLQLGLGAQGGLGFGWRKGIPWFVEGLLSGMWQTRGLAARLGVNVGLAW